MKTQPIGYLAGRASCALLGAGTRNGQDGDVSPKGRQRLSRLRTLVCSMFQSLS